MEFGKKSKVVIVEIIRNDWCDTYTFREVRPRSADSEHTSETSRALIPEHLRHLSFQPVPLNHPRHSDRPAYTSSDQT